MKSRLKVSGTTLLIRLPQEVDHHNAEEIKLEADRLLQEYYVQCIVFDFGKTVFMDSSGIGMMMGRYKNLRFMGGAAVAVGVSERIQKILTMSGIYKFMDIYEDYPEEFEVV